MKKILIILLSIGLITSCNDFDELNTNVKDPSEVPGEALFTGAQKNLVDQLTSTNVNYNVFRLFSQYWTQTQYPDESQYDLVTRTIPEQHWSVLYKDVLKDLNEAAIVLENTELLPTDDPVEKENKILITEIMSVFTYSILVETFGDVPYEQALDIEVLLPKYDDAQTIYMDLITRLDAARDALDPAHGSFGDEDNLYQGDVTKWIKFANSLKLRMGMLLADVDNASAKNIVEEAVANIFESNADNASLIYLSATPNTNPLYVDLVASGRHDFVPANTLIDIMQPREYEYLTDDNEDGVINEKDNATVVLGSVTMTDPRAEFYFASNVDADPTVEQTVYLGGLYGLQNNFGSSTHIADAIQEPTFPGTILDYAELEFLLAEAVERGYNVGGTAEEHYNKAIMASMDFWGVSEEAANNYLARTDVAYTTASGDYKQKIGLQKWIALYNRGFTGWREWRRLDYPVLLPSVDAVSALPVRYTYPIVEQTLNGSQRASAAAAIGGDDVTTKLFWDMN
ncbi:SusD/RagB family nutrient-binding outer membrane lipoprotein [Fulvivirga ligni]|uniref:SusD/RagB family nutrient-binding outer membrane lipoprotein n=1 Tax=Fulvivirga ligni TaxID=2904246 RepID=UPI001F1DAA68|nr:SusD/RagB family nutrient-binding outer membrane lipoprotein [Fulvivirga ligni]UII22626.1 SusD/RagB family nutrient-binding outer membrane lipoprotein [Fulvivirga ligni]